MLVRMYKEYEFSNRPMYRMVIPGKAVVGFMIKEKEGDILCNFYSEDPNVLKVAEHMVSNKISNYGPGWPKYLGEIDMPPGIVDKIISDGKLFRKAHTIMALNLEEVIKLSKIEELKK